MAAEIPLSMPDVTEEDMRQVREVLLTGRLSIGPFQDHFESLVAHRCKRRHAVAVSSGTAAIHLSLVALGIGPGDEVITTPFSFVATANAILYTGATPVFADIDPVTLNLDPKKVELAITPKTKAILAVEVFGNPAGIVELAAIAQRYEITLIEDACQAIGSRHQGQPVGAFGRCSTFSFYPNAQVTCGEGGMIVTDDDHLADLCRSLRNQGRPSGSPTVDPSAPGSWLLHERLGYSYRLSELHAALGCSQMARLDTILQKRRDVALLYFDKLMTNSDLILPTVEEVTEMSWYVFVVRLTDQYTARERDRIVVGLRRHDVGCSNYFPPIHLQPYFKQKFGFKPGLCPVAETVASRTITLPFFTTMDPTQVELACLTLNVMIQRERLLQRPDITDGDEEES